MKPVTKENLLEAIQKVEDQGTLLRTEYIGSEGCRCVIGHLMTVGELAHIIASRQINNKVELLDLDIAPEELTTLSDLQQINDQSEYLEDFLKAARNYMERHYETSN